MQFTDIIREATGYIERHYVESKNLSLWKARGSYAILIPASVIALALDIILGLGCTLAALATLGLSKPINKFMISYLQNSFMLSALPCFFFFKIISPTTELEFEESSYCMRKYSDGFEAFIQERYLNGDTFFKREIVTRLAMPVFAAFSLACHAVDGVIGIGGFVVSVVTLGCINKVNQLTLNYLCCTSAVLDLASAALRFVNPGAFTQTLQDLTLTELVVSDTLWILEELKFTISVNEAGETVVTRTDTSNECWNQLSFERQTAIIHAFQMQRIINKWRIECIQKWIKALSTLFDDPRKKKIFVSIHNFTKRISYNQSACKNNITGFDKNKLNLLLPFLDNQALLQNITKYQINEIDASVLIVCSDTTLRFLTENSEGVVKERIDAFNPEARKIFDDRSLDWQQMDK